MTQLHADDGFLAYFRFEHDPFLNRGSSFKFFSAKRRPVLVELHHIARYSKLMLVVTGPTGSGKTVLRQALVASSKETVQNIVIAPSTTTDAAAMLQHVSAALGLHDADIASVLRHIEQMLITGQEVHIIVDNAECLDESALLFLQRLAQGVNDACARVFVFSDSTICPLLTKVADNADLYHVIALEPWTAQEVNEYLEQRLAAAGRQLDVFTEQQLATVFSESQGWPGQVNDAAKTLLLSFMLAETAPPKSVTRIPFKHLLILLIVAAALIAIWLTQSPTSGDGEKIVNTPSSVIDTAVIQGQAADQKNTVTVDLPLGQAIEPVVREPLAQAILDEDEDYPVLEEDLLNSAPSIEASAPVIIAPVAVSQAPKEVITASKVAAIPLAQKVIQSSAKKPVKAVAAPPKVAPANTGLSGSAGHSQWYKQQATSRYTLQVLGTRTESTAQAFVKQNSSQYHYFRKLHQGQVLFVVTFGSFTDRAAAQAAIRTLPEKLRNDKPWPRTFLSIQQELR